MYSKYCFLLIINLVKVADNYVTKQIAKGELMKTIKIPVSQLKPDMVIADSVYTFNNQLIIQEGTKLSDKIITRLKFYSVDLVRIKVEDSTPDQIPAEPLMKELYHEKLKGTEEFKEFNENVQNMTGHIKYVMQDIIDGNNKIDLLSLYYEMNNIISSSRNGLHVFDMLHCMHDHDDQTYAHSVNVSIICKILATWLGFSKRDVETATLCGLLHDIGKVTIPNDILLKPAKLTDEEYSTVKTHAIRGYELLRPLDINIHIKMSAMMHHERCDGSGYPMGLHAQQIDKFAKIVMIADVFEAMTNARVYRGPLCPFEVISIFETEGLTKYEPKYIMTFFDHITQLYLHNTIRLNTGEIGEIVLMNRNNLTRPVIRIDDKFIDLATNQDLFVTAIL